MGARKGVNGVCHPIRAPDGSWAPQLDVYWFLGAHPKRVFASGGIDYYRDGREVVDNISCLYEYEIPSPKGPSSSNGDAGIAESYTVRVNYTSLCNNAYEGAAELIMGTRGSLYLTSSKGLLFQEKGTDSVPWEGGKDKAAADANAAVVAAGKTLKLSTIRGRTAARQWRLTIEEGTTRATN